MSQDFGEFFSHFDFFRAAKIGNLIDNWEFDTNTRRFSMLRLKIAPRKIPPPHRFSPQIALFSV
jgi:hypothetical protein